MCGIAGVFAYRTDAERVRREELERALAQMIPRGPDAGGTWYADDGRVALGSRRLAIIDLSHEAEQPMKDSSGELVIVFNGEIYNYAELRASLIRGGAVFRTHSDTEVLLELYRRDGVRMLGLLRGMYAFAIWDRRARRLFVARDPYGIKPLYFADGDGTFRFASTVKALLAGGAVPATRDPAAMAGFFLTGSVPEPFTTIEAIRAVEAGTCFFIDEHGRVAPQRHNSIAGVFQRAVDQRAVARLTEPEILLREHIEESVQHHLVSDVPVGVFLSAGIDSGAIATVASRFEPLQTFTLTFEEFRGTEGDESPLAERLARELGTRHVTRLVTRDEFLADVPKIFAAMDQPTIDGVNTWFVSKAAHEAGVKVALSGVGGDELFGSYRSFINVPRLVRIGANPLLSRAAHTASVAGFSHRKLRFIRRYGSSYAGAYLIQRGLFLPDELPQVLPEDVAVAGLERLQIVELFQNAIEPDPGTPFGRVAALEASLYMRNQLLRDADWAAMAHSVEVRTPLVDSSLLRQIAPLVIEHGAECKAALATVLPPWLRDRKKTGFFVPMRQWMDLPPDGTTTRMRSWARRVWEEFR